MASSRRSSRNSASGDKPAHLNMSEFIKMESINEQLEGLNTAFDGDPTIDSLEDFAFSLQKQAAQAQKASQSEHKWRLIATLSILCFIALAAVLFGVIVAAIQLKKDIYVDEDTNTLVDSEGKPIKARNAAVTNKLGDLPFLDGVDLNSIQTLMIPTKDHNSEEETLEIFKVCSYQRYRTSYTLFGCLKDHWVYVNTHESTSHVHTAGSRAITHAEFHKNIELLSTGEEAKTIYHGSEGELVGFDRYEGMVLNGYNDILADYWEDGRCIYTTLDDCHSRCCHNPDCKSMDYKPPWWGVLWGYSGCGKCCLSSDTHETQPQDFEDAHRWNYYAKIENGQCDGGGPSPTPPPSPTPTMDDDPTTDSSEEEMVTAAPTPDGTGAPTPAVTGAPAPDSTSVPTPDGTAVPTPDVTNAPTPDVTNEPTPAVTEAPTDAPPPPPTPAPPEVLSEEIVEVQCMGETLAAGTYSIFSTSITGVQYNVSFTVFPEESGVDVSDEIVAELNADSTFSGAGCIADLGLTVLHIGCPGTSPEEHMISFDGEPGQEILAANSNGVVCNPPLEPPPEIFCPQFENITDRVECDQRIGRAICTILLNYGPPYDVNAGSCDPVNNLPTVTPIPSVL